jgi:hypothetical protein
MKVKRSYAIPPVIDQWLKDKSRESGESISSIVSRILTNEKEKGK